MSSLVAETSRRDGQPLQALTAMECLRRETSAEHTLLEQATRMMSPDLSVRDYLRYLTEMWVAHAAIEPRLAEVDGLSAVLPDVGDRHKLRWLELDLAELGVSPAELRTLLQNRPRIPCGSVAEALGALYVLEGSTLGGRLIRRRLAEVLGPRIAGATRYLDAYSDVGPMWRRFGAAVNAYGEAHPEAGRTLVAAAVATFQALRAGWNARSCQ